MTLFGDVSLTRCRREFGVVKHCSVVYFLIMTAILIGHLVNASTATDGGGQERGCSAVRHAYGLKGFNEHEFPQEMISGDQLQICKRTLTCCTDEMETKLNLQSSLEFDKLVTDEFSFYVQNFASRYVKFDEYFNDLIEQSHTGMNDMFIRTYGMLYEQNVQLFRDLYNDLRSYYQSSDVNIADVLDKFFSILMQRIFRLLNDQYQFSDSFFGCIGEHMNQLKPFGDIPHKMFLQVKRSFTAARVFVEGLATGRDVILAMSKLEHNLPCSSELMRLTYCSYCGGHVNVKPCKNYCLKVLQKCFSYYSEVNRVWNAYLEQMYTLSKRMDGPLNIEMIISPLGVKISEAIMQFQENSGPFASKVFQGCGEPELQRKSSEAPDRTRRRREAPRNASDFNPQRTSNSTIESGNHSNAARGRTRDNLLRLIRDVQSKLELMKDMWKKLPDVLCNKTSAAESEIEQFVCWDGFDTQSSSSIDGRDDVISSNETHKGHQNTVIEKELFQLRTVITRLRLAHSGIDENLSDNDDGASGTGQDEDLSGSGSGREEQLDHLLTTKDLYIEAVSVPETSTGNLGLQNAPSSTVQPKMASRASNIYLRFHESLAPVLVILWIRICAVF